MDKSPVKSRTVWMGAIAAAAGYLQVVHAVTVDADTQARLVEAAFGLVAIFSGKGAILFRILAATPKIKVLMEELVRIRTQLETGAPRGGTL